MTEIPSNLVERAENSFPVQDEDGNPQYREGQQEAIRRVAKAFEDGYDYVVLDAPTGYGKSFINTSIMRAFNDGFYITPQNSLIQQIESDDLINEYFAPLKGRNNYWCDNKACKIGKGERAHRAHKCASSETPKKAPHRPCCSLGLSVSTVLEEHENFRTNMSPDELRQIASNPNICEYPKAVLNAVNSDFVLTNFHYFVLNPHLGKRDVMVIDEAHNLEMIGLDFMDFIFSENNIPFFEQIEDDIPEGEEEILEYLKTDFYRKLSDELNEIEDAIESEGLSLEKAYITRGGDLEDLSRIKSILQNLKRKVDSLSEFDGELAVEDLRDDSDEPSKVVLKPLYADKFFHQNIIDEAEKFLFSSATFVQPKKQLQLLGIDPEDVKVVSMENLFPVENREIRVEPTVDMSGKNLGRKEFKAMADKIADICRKHPTESGIVHSKSYNKMENIKQHLQRKSINHEVVTLEREDDRDEILDNFKDKEKPAIFLSVAMEEGVDLKDDLARFNIVAKVPNLYAGDIRVSERLDKGEWSWYFMNTAIDLVQAYGRTTRSKDDNSVTYIVDSNFTEFLTDKRRKQHFPEWFLEAVNRVGQNSSSVTGY